MEFNLWETNFLPRSVSQGSSAYGFDGLIMTDLKGIFCRQPESRGCRPCRFCDGWRLYIADRQAFLLARSTPTGVSKNHAPLACRWIFDAGANAICIDTKDRVYAATPLGIGRVSFGVIDAILPSVTCGSIISPSVAKNIRPSMFARKEKFQASGKTIGKTVDYRSLHCTSGYYDGD